MSQKKSLPNLHMAQNDHFPLVYVAVLNWHGAEHTITCLHSLFRLSYGNLRVAVVDNASTDDSVEKIAAVFPQVEILRTNENLGYAGGNLRALQHALQVSAKLFWILNNDTTVKFDALDQLVAAYRQYGDALYGTVLLEAPDSDQLALPIWKLDEHQMPVWGKTPYLGQSYDGCFADKSPRRVATLSGSSLLIPTEVAQKHGFMDTNFFLYAEETDYCLRLGAANVPSWIVPGALVYHNPRGAHKNHPELKPITTYYQYRNRLTLVKRHRTKLHFWRAVGLHVMYVIIWLLSVPLRGPQALEVARFGGQGIFDAIRGRLGKVYAPEDHLGKA